MAATEKTHTFTCHLLSGSLGSVAGIARGHQESPHHHRDTEQAKAPGGRGGALGPETNPTCGGHRGKGWERWRRRWGVGGDGMWEEMGCGRRWGVGGDGCGRRWDVGGDGCVGGDGMWEEMGCGRRWGVGGDGMWEEMGESLGLDEMEGSGGGGRNC